jgi:hypothetical protein
MLTVSGSLINKCTGEVGYTEFELLAREDGSACVLINGRSMDYPWFGGTQMSQFVDMLEDETFGIRAIPVAS